MWDRFDPDYWPGRSDKRDIKRPNAPKIFQHFSASFSCPLGELFALPERLMGHLPFLFVTRSLSCDKLNDVKCISYHFITCQISSCCAEAVTTTPATSRMHKCGPLGLEVLSLFNHFGLHGPKGPLASRFILWKHVETYM